MKNICVFGSSIASGLNDFKEGGWCDLLKRHFLDKDIFVYNLGVSGDDSLDLLGRFDNECKARKPDIIIIAVTGNDSQYLIEEDRFRIDVKDTVKNFKQLISKAKCYTKSIIIIGLTKVDEEKINAVYIKNKKKYYKNDNLRRYDKAIEGISSKENVYFIPMFDVIDKDDLDDGLHPHSEGHKKMFFKIKEYLSKLDL